MLNISVVMHVDKLFYFGENFDRVVEIVMDRLKRAWIKLIASLESDY